MYTGSRDGIVYALDAISGAERWRVKLDDWMTSPVVSDGVVYVGANRSEPRESRAYALSAITGEVLWRFEAGNEGHFNSPPVVDGDAVFIVSYYGRVFALDAASGEERWRSYAPNFVWHSPAVRDGVVYVSGEHGYVTAFDAATGRELWQFQTRYAASPSPEQGKLASGLSSIPQSTENLSGPVVVDGIVYVGSSFRSVIALNAATGKQLWRYQTRGEMHSFPPTLIGGVVYVGSSNGKVYALDAKTGEAYWASPTGGSVWDIQSPGDGLSTSAP